MSCHADLKVILDQVRKTREMLKMVKPPCPECKYWHPEADKDSGVTFCHVHKDEKKIGMCSDFSCFEPRK